MSSPNITWMLVLMFIALILDDLDYNINIHIIFADDMGDDFNMMLLCIKNFIHIL